MTEEGLIRLKDFIARRQYYMERKKDFASFARSNSDEYTWEYWKKRIGYIVFWLSIPIFATNDRGLMKWLSMFGIILGLIAGISAKPSKKEMQRLIAEYLRQNDKPAEELELALRVFTDEKHYSDIHQIQSWIWQGIITQADIDDSGLDIDLD